MTITKSSFPTSTGHYHSVQLVKPHHYDGVELRFKSGMWEQIFTKSRNKI